MITGHLTWYRTSLSKPRVLRCPMDDRLLSGDRCFGGITWRVEYWRSWPCWRLACCWLRVRLDNWIIWNQWRRVGWKRFNKWWMNDWYRGWLCGWRGINWIVSIIVSTATSEKKSIYTCSQVFSFGFNTFPDKHACTIFADCITTRLWGYLQWSTFWPFKRRYKLKVFQTSVSTIQLHNGQQVWPWH